MYKFDETLIKEKLDVKTKGISTVWVVIPNLKIVIAGDLCFYATSTSRDGQSHCHCTYCLVPQQQHHGVKNVLQQTLKSQPA